MLLHCALKDGILSAQYSVFIAILLEFWPVEVLMEHFHCILHAKIFICRL
jgi:hypothetical protein